MIYPAVLRDSARINVELQAPVSADKPVTCAVCAAPNAWLPQSAFKGNYFWNVAITSFIIHVLFFFLFFWLAIQGAACVDAPPGAIVRLKFDRADFSGSSMCVCVCVSVCFCLFVFDCFLLFAYLFLCLFVRLFTWIIFFPSGNQVIRTFGILAVVNASNCTNAVSGDGVDGQGLTLLASNSRLTFPTVSLKLKVAG